MMQKILPVLLVLWLLTGPAATIAQSPSSEKSQSKQVKIGVIAVQSGPLAPVGKGIVNAIRLADEQHDEGDKVKFIFEDDGAQQMRAVSAANKLITHDNVAALITFTGGTSAAVAPIAEKRNVPLLTIAAGDQHAIGKTYVYRLYLSTREQVDILHKSMEHEGLKRLAVVTTTQESLVRLRDIFVKSAGSAIVGDEEVVGGDTDTYGLATRINSKHPDAIVLYLLPPQLSAFTKAIRDQGYKGKFYGGMQVFNYPEIAASHGSLVGTVFPVADIKNSDKFSNDYKNRFKEPLASDQEVYGYDGATVLIDAASKKSILQYLQSLKEIQGLAGTYPRRENNFFEVPAVLKRIASESSVELVSPKKDEAGRSIVVQSSPPVSP